MKKYVNGQYIDLTEEEIQELEILNRKYEVKEKYRPLTSNEVYNLIIKAQINNINIDDQTSLRMMGYYPTFDECIGQEVNTGFKFTYQYKLYKVIQSHTMNEAWIPNEGSESLYERIDEQHDGDEYDPIPYEGNMSLEKDKYYIQDEVTYLCTRNSDVALHNPLSELVGLYVEAVESTL